MKESLKILINDKITFWGFFLGLIIIIISSIYTLISFKQLPPFVPLYNKLPWGFGRLGSQTEIFVPLEITLLFYLGNLFLSAISYGKMPILSRMIALVTILLCLLTTIFLFKIITLVL